MELQIMNNNGIVPEDNVITNPTTESNFIEANTIPMTLDEIRDKHLIPVYSKDNTALISQIDFIQNTREIVEEISGKGSTFPNIRVSHPKKGRIYAARQKSVAELQEHEKTIYYERMAFICEIPSITENVSGQHLTMCFGGVKAYNNDSLNNYFGSIQRFKVFIGFKVKVCTNLCVWTDGSTLEIKARSITELTDKIHELISQYNSEFHLQQLNRLSEYELTEQQFAKLVGRARMYHHLPKDKRKLIPELLVSDSQISQMTRAYYRDNNFRQNQNGGIDLWNLYNLLTGSIKSSYIDSFVDRGANAFDFTNGIADALDDGRDGKYDWFLN